MPYNIHEYIAEICDSFRNVLAQVTDINKEYVSVSFIYHYIYKNVSEDDKNWKWIVGREQTMQTPLNQFVEKENTVYHTLIKGSETVETEMGMLYLRHLDSESCLQQRQHWGQRLHRKNKELWKKR